MFGNLAPADAYDNTDISTAMLNAWFEFARTGTPGNQHGSAWPKYDNKDPQCTFLEDTYVAVRFSSVRSPRFSDRCE